MNGTPVSFMWNGENVSGGCHLWHLGAQRRFAGFVLLQVFEGSGLLRKWVLSKENAEQIQPSCGEATKQPTVVGRGCDTVALRKRRGSSSFPPCRENDGSIHWLVSLYWLWRVGTWRKNTLLQISHDKTSVFSDKIVKKQKYSVLQSHIVISPWHRLTSFSFSLQTYCQPTSWGLSFLFTWF